MQAAESPGFCSHFVGALRSTCLTVGHLGFAASNVVDATCNLVSIPFRPYNGTLDTASSLGKAVVFTASSLKEAGSAVTNTAYAVADLVTPFLPTTK